VAKYFEDMPVGTSDEPDASHTFTAEEIKDFASKWDPMPFHVDEELAAQTPLGKLFACSTHILSAGVKLTHATMDEPVAAVAGLGWKEVKLPLPVCAGDTVRLKTEVIEARESKSKPDRGIINTQNTLVNQNDEIVAQFQIATMILKRPEAS
jgi:acyl dehydratase